MYPVSCDLKAQFTCTIIFLEVFDLAIILEFCLIWFIDF